MIVIGQFGDLNNPDRFVWLRGFSDMDSRAHQLQEFYGGPIWKEQRAVANATIIDPDNVLLFRPARGGIRMITRTDCSIASCVTNLEVRTRLIHI